jgi:hypothetical protein
MIKFYSLIYKLTGYYSNYAKTKEYEHILNRLPSLYNDFLSQKKNSHLTLFNLIDIEIGSWQANNGFYRKLKI